MSRRTLITNPVLEGFNPDPSILRVGKDYFIATSTFEWFPGVQIHHSRDLVHWRLLTRPLDRVSQINLAGDPDSGGVWAPCLSYADDLFHLVYSDVKGRFGAYKVVHNYLVTAPDIAGAWSEPIHLNSSGFDPSLFHDADGRKWLLNMLWDHRRADNRFGGIVMQEYSSAEHKLTGLVRKIFDGTGLGKTEGPHIYRRGEWYYLIVAEGGTGFAHAVTLARSRHLAGPYEVHPQNPILTSVDDDESPLQKAGHASLVELENGEWYMAYLCSRPLGPERRCVLGRETALHKCEWHSDGWLWPAGGRKPLLLVEAPLLAPGPAVEPKGEGLLSPDLEIGVNFQSLRVPFDESWVSATARPGWLRLVAQEAPTSLFRQSMVARRVTSFDCEAVTCVDFSPASFQQMAGLIFYYNTRNHYYLRVSHDDVSGRTVSVCAMDRGEYSEPFGSGMPIGNNGCVFLRGIMCQGRLSFAVSTDGRHWHDVGKDLDATILSDDYDLGPQGIWNFTGAFVGICAHDMSGQGIHADFRDLNYRTLARPKAAPHPPPAETRMDDRDSRVG